MRLRRFSILGWQGCQDLAGFVMGEEVERVELGPPPLVYWDEVGDFDQKLVEAALYTGSVAIDINPLVQARIDEVIARYPKNPAMTEKIQAELDE